MFLVVLTTASGLQVHDSILPFVLHLVREKKKDII